jgi:hypothetical protein
MIDLNRIRETFEDGDGIHHDDGRDMIGEIERLRAALGQIAKDYTPNWKPGDTHESTQRLSSIAKDALQTKDANK